MGKTFAEKILAHKAGLVETTPGQIVTVQPDKLLTHDNTSAIAKTFRKIGVELTTWNQMKFAAAVAAYAAMGWIIRPQLDPDQHRWRWTRHWSMMDEPFGFRVSVENPKLCFLILFFPGRIIGGAVVCLFRLLSSKCGGVSQHSRPRPPN